MAHIAEHLSVEELGWRAGKSEDACAARHDQAIWLLTQGQTVSQVAAVTGFVSRWLERLARRYNQFGPDALGDLRRNGAPARLLTRELLDRLRMRLETPPPDGGAWTMTKIVASMAQDLGLVSVYLQRAWEALQALGWSIQAPRLKNPAAASPEEQAAFKNNAPSSSPRKKRAIPAAPSRSSPRISTALG